MALDSVLEVAQRVFSGSYFEARNKFRTALPGACEYRSESLGPGGETLYTDAAYIGPQNAQNLLVLVSGTHGAEGYCGSAAQLAFLEAGLHNTLPPSTAVLMVHALNCYGFAWDRRVTAEGCDLNRNFVDFSHGTPANPHYEEIAEYLVPKDISPEALEQAEAAIRAYRAKHGEWHFQTARKSGQYTCPGGMFYGGTRPTEARLILERIAADFNVASRSNVIIIDYHSGLGPYGYGELQCEQASGLDGYERAVSIFGPSVTSPDLGTSSSVILHGTQDELWERLLGDRHTYVCLEYGTYDAERSRRVLRNDHWLFTYRPEEADAPLGRQIRNESRQHYYPERTDWKEMAIARAHLVHRQAIEALGAGGSARLKR